VVFILFTSNVVACVTARHASAWLLRYLRPSFPCSCSRTQYSYLSINIATRKRSIIVIIFITKLRFFMLIVIIVLLLNYVLLPYCELQCHFGRYCVYPCFTLRFSGFRCILKIAKSAYEIHAPVSPHGTTRLPLIDIVLILCSRTRSGCYVTDRVEI